MVECTAQHRCVAFAFHPPCPSISPRRAPLPKTLPFISLPYLLSNALGTLLPLPVLTPAPVSQTSSPSLFFPPSSP